MTADDLKDREFVEFTVDSPLYRQAFELRNAVLRRPLGLDLAHDDLSREADSLHFALCESGTVVATLLIVPQPERGGLLRQMCVCPQRQGCGLGRELVQQVEGVLKARGFQQITLQARTTAIGFYESLGYLRTGNTAVTMGIPHEQMTRLLH